MIIIKPILEIMLFVLPTASWFVWRIKFPKQSALLIIALLTYSINLGIFITLEHEDERKFQSQISQFDINGDGLLDNDNLNEKQIDLLSKIRYLHADDIDFPTFVFLSFMWQSFNYITLGFISHLLTNILPKESEPSP